MATNARNQNGRDYQSWDEARQEQEQERRDQQERDRSEDKARVARDHGCQHVIVTRGYQFADEVQRLAERAANATKQIEVLVRTIQADTNEAVVSMERTTTDVVGGALLAENAGAALEEMRLTGRAALTMAGHACDPVPVPAPVTPSVVPLEVEVDTPEAD
jgi:hypothetical protein